MEARRSHSSTDVRRRRLLANHDTNELLAEFQALSRPQPVPAYKPRHVTTVDCQVLHRMVSGELWKHCLLILAVVLMAFASVWSELHKTPALQNVMLSGQPRMSQGLAGVFLIIAGQLSMLIGWIRSRSSVDFSGRYRCWKWLAGCLVIAGGLWITNTQNSLPQLARMLAQPLIGGVYAAQKTLVVVPVAGLSIWVLSRVLPDMSRNRCSQVLFSLGVLATFARVLLTWGTVSGSWTPPVLDGILLSATGLMVCSLLLHTRYVLYICEDPPEQRSTPTPANNRVVDRFDHNQSETDDSLDADSQPELQPEELMDDVRTAAPSPAPDTDESPEVISTDWTKSSRQNHSSRQRRRSKRRTRKAA